MFKLVNALKDSIIVILFLPFPECCISLTFRHRHMQIIIEINDCISMLKNEFGN